MSRRLQLYNGNALVVVGEKVSSAEVASKESVPATLLTQATYVCLGKSKRISGFFNGVLWFRENEKTVFCVNSVVKSADM